MVTLDAPALTVAAVVAFYMGSALVMVFVNKAVLNNAPDLPLTFLMAQMLIAVVLLHVTAAISPRIEIPKFDIHVAKKLVPVVFVNILGLVFNTLCLRDVEASFFQIARGLVLPLTILVSSAQTRVVPSSKVFIAAIAVTVGFLFGIAPSSDLPISSRPSLLSLLYGFLSSLFIAFHAVLIKTSLPHCNNSTIQLAWWTNAGSAVFLLPALLYNGEPATLSAKLYTELWDGRVFLWGSMVTGFFGFLLCVAGLLSIKITSPITHMFSSAARSVLQTMLGFWFFGDVLTVNRAVSISVILLGTMYYTWIKSAETASAVPTRVTDVESRGEAQTKLETMNLRDKSEFKS